MCPNFFLSRRDTSHYPSKKHVIFKVSVKYCKHCYFCFHNLPTISFSFKDVLFYDVFALHVGYLSWRPKNRKKTNKNQNQLDILRLTQANQRNMLSQDRKPVYKTLKQGWVHKRSSSIWKNYKPKWLVLYELDPPRPGRLILSIYDKRDHAIMNMHQPKHLITIIDSYDKISVSIEIPNNKEGRFVIATKQRRVSIY